MALKGKNMYNNISFSANFGFRKGLIARMTNKKPDFEINPLDINIAKMQNNLLKRLELEVPENGDFAPVIEEYQSKDPTLDLSQIKIACRYVKDESPKKETRELEISCIDKNNGNERKKSLFQGTKQELIEYLKGDSYFGECKNLANK